MQELKSAPHTAYGFCLLMVSLPSVLGSIAALCAAIVGILARVGPLTLVMRSCAAYALFAAFGMVFRYLLGDSPVDNDRAENDPLEGINPGDRVGDVLKDNDHQ